MSAIPELFAWLAQALEQRTPMNAAQCRGTVRLALKNAGLEAKSVTAPELRVVLHKIMPRELEVRGIDDGTKVCTELVADLDGADVAPAEPSPRSQADSVFQRIFS